MSIIAYVGLPGSGKTYGVIENVLLQALKDERTIYTNIPLQMDEIGKTFNVELINYFDKREVDLSFFDLEKRGAGAVWIVDECQYYFPSGLKQTNLPASFVQYITEHRHFADSKGQTTELVFITQDLSQVCLFVRNLVDETYKSIKLSLVGANTKYRIDIHSGAITGQKNPKPIRQIYGKYKPSVYKYYTSHTQAKSKNINEKKVDDRANIFKSGYIKYFVPLAFLLLFGSVYSLFTVYKGFTDKKFDDEITVDEKKPIEKNIKVETKKRQLFLNNSEYQITKEIEMNWLPISDEYRITGLINGVYLIWGENGTREIHSRNCDYTKKTREPYCVVRGKMVTYYSYIDPQITNNDREYVETVRGIYD